MKPAVSVIVPVYKVEQYLDKCVQSILDQTFRDFELLLVDDVLTTGATSSAAAQVLMANGAKAVRLLCCARTPVKARSAPPGAGKRQKTT